MRVHEPRDDRSTSRVEVRSASTETHLSADGPSPSDPREAAIADCDGRIVFEPELLRPLPDPRDRTRRERSELPDPSDEEVGADHGCRMR